MSAAPAAAHQGESEPCSSGKLNGKGIFPSSHPRAWRSFVLVGSSLDGQPDNTRQCLVPVCFPSYEM